MTATDDTGETVGRQQQGRPRLVTATAVAAGFVGVTALGGGVEMLLFPHGNQFVPGAWLADVPLVDSWVLPGLVLGVGFGVGGIVTTYGLLRRPRWRALDKLQRPTGRHWSWLATLALGAGLAGWVLLEVAFIPQRSPIEVLYAALAAALVVLPLQRSVREHLTPTSG